MNLLTTGDSTDDYGYSIVLTLDEYIQYVAEKELAAACKQWNAHWGTVIVMASQTAEILALASYPTYDLNTYALGSEEAKRNFGVWYAYEPGSIFKIVASSAVLNEGIMTPESTVFCENGRYRLSNGRVIRDVSAKGLLTLEQVIHKSSNIGMIKVVKQLGHEDFGAYIEKYGFGKPTGVDLPYEHSGSLYAVKRWDTHSLGSVPFGQGIMVTPLQMVNALNVIANDGKLLRPHITREIRDSSGKVIKKMYPIEVRQVLHPQVAKQMADILVGVVEGGSGRRARVEGYRVAGKTGTAQKAEPNGKGYAGKEVMSFMGFLPAENPMVSIIVMLDEPTGARFSGQIAGPLFQKVAAQTMQYLKQTEFFGPQPAKSPRTCTCCNKANPGATPYCERRGVVKLRALLHGLNLTAHTGSLDIDITGIVSDNREVELGNVFVCYQGISVDSHIFVADALQKGAAAVIGEKPVTVLGIPTPSTTYVQVPNGRRAMSLLSANWHGNPAQHLKLIGITGTNGKTSTAHLIHAILKSSGRKTALIGTVGHQYTNAHGEVKALPASLTTPDAFALHALFRQFVEEGVEYVTMETSSQGLALQRLAGLAFDTAVFTNFTQDHLDYHQTMEEYLKAKLMLFEQLSEEGVAVLNSDSPVTERIAEICSDSRLLMYGLGNRADLCAEDIAFAHNRLAFTAVTPEGGSVLSCDCSENIIFIMLSLLSLWGSVTAARCQQSKKDS